MKKICQNCKWYSEEICCSGESTWCGEFMARDMSCPAFEATKETKLKTDGSLSELGKLPIDDLKPELLKYGHEELAQIAMAGVFASNMMMEE